MQTEGGMNEATERKNSEGERNGEGGGWQTVPAAPLGGVLACAR